MTVDMDRAWSEVYVQRRDPVGVTVLLFRCLSSVLRCLEMPRVMRMAPSSVL